MDKKFEKEAISRYLEIQKLNRDADLLSIKDDKRLIKSLIRVMGALIVKMSDPKKSDIPADIFNNICNYAEKITGLLNQVYIDYDLKESVIKRRYQVAVDKYRRNGKEVED